MENARLTGQPRQIFLSGCWKTGTNSNLAFASEDLNTQLQTGQMYWYVREVFKIPTSTITNHSFKKFGPVPRELYKCWNFHKVNWKLHRLITNQLSQELPSPDSSSIDEDFCSTMFEAAKLSICRMKQLVQLLLPCCLMKNKKITGPRLSITSTSCTPVS